VHLRGSSAKDLNDIRTSVIFLWDCVLSVFSYRSQEETAKHLAHFLIFRKMKGGLWDHLAICLSVSLYIPPNFVGLWGSWDHLAVCASMYPFFFHILCGSCRMKGK
jgi:hypothetical protein